MSFSSSTLYELAKGSKSSSDYPTFVVETACPWNCLVPVPVPVLAPVLVLVLVLDLVLVLALVQPLSVSWQAFLPL